MPQNRKKRIVIDTNLWISFLISRNFQKLDHLLLNDKVRVLFSTELLDEIKTTITKPKLQKFFPEEAMQEMLFALEDYSELIIVTSHQKVCRDSKDDFLLALSKDGKADFLLTGDKDLLDVNQYGKTRIMTIATFLEEIE